METSDAALDDGLRQRVADELHAAGGLRVYAASVSSADGKVLALARDGRARRLLAVMDPSCAAACHLPSVARKDFVCGGSTIGLLILETSSSALDWLRQLLPWTVPTVQGLATSAGLGDRLGLATPGHLRAAAGTGVVPFVAQQSIREMTRTQRTARQVMDDATWGVFEAGWRTGFGSDADHLKQPADIDTCSAVGFTMYTIDPGDHVCSRADTMSASELTAAMARAAWGEFETSQVAFKARYLGRAFRLDGGDPVRFDEDTLARAMVKYGGAIRHTVRMYRHLERARSGRPFELEVSIDETATPTTVAEHYLIAAELKRLGVRWVSLAPRFVGEFEKGIDYKGDLTVFRRSFAQHAAIARTLGPYKLSLHSGSDKFSVYPIAAELTGGLVHLKTAGTSYLEALRVVARKDPALFRRILDFTFERFETDRASYHISARLSAVPRPSQLADGDLETVLDGNDGRQLLHVTFGSILTSKSPNGEYLFRDAFRACLIDHEDEHYDVLSHHLGGHVLPFSRRR
ncbi:MAG: hypothetical protein HY718_02520 [Planctomycetes bacterium]|nr:hypothetical protein [Planctomycetota bacterium]